ncbi:MAG: cache domain-containing protein [Pseudomonadota bacterium]
MPVVRSFLFGLVFVQLISAAAIIGWSYYLFRSELNQLAEFGAQETVARSVAATEAYFGPFESAVRAAEGLVSREILTRDRENQLVRYLHDQLQLWPQFDGLFFGYPDGEFYYVLRNEDVARGGTQTKIIRINGEERTVELTWRDAGYATVETAFDPEDAFDPRIRPWYKGALEADEVAWTDPYIFFTSRKPGITAAISVMDGTDDVMAVIGVDIEIDQISDYLQRFAFGEGRLAFVISAGGDVISHSEFDTVLENSSGDGDAPRFMQIGELEGIAPSIRDEIVARLGQQPATEPPAVWRDRSSDGNFIVTIGRIPGTNWPWQIVAIFPEADTIGQSGRVMLMLVGVALLVTACTLAAGLMLARRISQPLGVLRENSKMALLGGVEFMETVRSGSVEIDDTAAALKELAEGRRYFGAPPTQDEP